AGSPRGCARASPAGRYSGKRDRFSCLYIIMLSPLATPCMQQACHKMNILCYNMCTLFLNSGEWHDCIAWRVLQFGGGGRPESGALPNRAPCHHPWQPQGDESGRRRVSFDALRPGAVVVGPLLPEPVEVLAIAPRGQS